MSRFHGLIGVVLILAIAILVSSNRKAINKRTIISGLILQITIAFAVLKIHMIQNLFEFLGKGMQKIEYFAKQGANFVLGNLMVSDPSGIQSFDSPSGFVFAFNVTATIILVSVLVSMLYHVGIMQRIVAVIAKGMHFVMRVSGAEALSNVASAFVGQIEAQIMIKPYLQKMTKSELLASMSGSLACIAGGILIVYANMGAQVGMNLAPKLIMASLMAAPGALVISKLIMPETESSDTYGKVSLKVKSEHTNLIDAISSGASEGFKISMNVIAMLIGFIALISLLDWSLLKIGHLFNPDLHLSLNWIFAKIFYPFAWAMGVPKEDIASAATLLGQKITINEFIAFKNLTSGEVPVISEKGLLIITTAICGFANFASVGMQIGGIGALAPERRKDLAKLGFKALLCGTLASYLSASIAGIIF